MLLFTNSLSLLAEEEKDWKVQDWQERLDGQRSLAAITVELASEYEASPGEIEQDVLGLVEQLQKRGMVVEVNPRSFHSA